MPKNDNTIVDVSKIKTFTEKHLDIVKQAYKNHWKTFYPELYGNKVPPEIKFSHFEIVPNNGHFGGGLGSQKNRYGGENVKYHDIKQNIDRNGFKLKYPPISVFRWNNHSPEEIITGNTRAEILNGFNINNFIVAVYVPSGDKYTKEQVRDALCICGQTFNTSHDPYSPPSKADIKRSVELAINLYEQTNGLAGIPCTIPAIEDRVDLLCGEGCFQQTTRSQLVYEIYNTRNPHDIVISWSDNKNTKYRISNFMIDNKLVNTDTVKYIHTPHSMYSKLNTRAQRLAAEFPKAEIRIVIHTGTLSGYDLERVYRSRIREFVTSYSSIVSNANLASDNGATFSRIKIYAALPALSSCHDITVPFFINMKKGEAYQKSNKMEVESFDIYEDDDLIKIDFEEYDEAA